MLQRSKKTEQGAQPAVSGLAKLAIAAMVAVLLLPGCGQSSQQAVLSDTTLERQIRHLDQGMSTDLVEDELGDPVAETANGHTSGLSYGIWQLTFVDDRLKTRSKALVPRGKGSKLDPRMLSSKIMSLSLGIDIQKVEARLGTPEMLYVIYERDSVPIKILRYGSRELTFVHGKLSQRTQ